MIETTDAQQGEQVKVTMIELEAGQGYNEGPELRLVLEANHATTVVKAIETLGLAEQETYRRYSGRVSDFEPLPRTADFWFRAEYTFPA